MAHRHTGQFHLSNPSPEVASSNVALVCVMLTIKTKQYSLQVAFLVEKYTATGEAMSNVP